MTSAPESAEKAQVGLVPYALVEGIAHVMVPPDFNDLRWTCTQRSRGCNWAASEAFSTVAGRASDFLSDHKEARCG